MAKDNFDLRSFLIENKMTVTSRGNEIRKRFLKEGFDLEEKKAGQRKPFKFDIDMPAGINEAEDVDMDVDVEDDDFIDPEDLPMDEDVSRGDIHRGRLESDEPVGYGSPDKMRQKIFDRKGIDRESFNRFALQAVGKFHGNIGKAMNLVCQAYELTPKQARFLVDPGIINWKTAGLGNKYGRTINEDFADIANLAAREQDRYADVDGEEEPGTAPDVFGGLGSTSYEAPEDFGDYDEEAIRRSYTGLKNQGISDERAMGILAKSYDIPEETIRAMFRTELGNVRQKAVQVDEPKDKVSTFRMPKRSSAAEKAAAADMRGEFDDDVEDEREFVKPGETDPDDEEGAEAGSKEAATGTVNIPVDGKDMSLTIPENFAMDETEAGLVKRLQGYKRPAVAIPYLQRALNAAQKAASNVGSGKIYMYLCSDGAYHTYGSKVKLGDTIPVEKRNGNVIDTKITQFVATIDCSGAPATSGRRQAADAAKTDAQVGTATSGYGSMELSDDEIQKYVTSKAWNAKSIEQKLRDEYFPWSEEASEYMDNDEIASAKAELKNETPVDPESEWAKSFVGRK